MENTESGFNAMESGGEKQSFVLYLQSNDTNFKHWTKVLYRTLTCMKYCYYFLPLGYCKQCQKTRKFQAEVISTRRNPVVFVSVA
jgi:hypothetical protein